jgi:hypothetical protein
MASVSVSRSVRDTMKPCNSAAAILTVVLWVFWLVPWEGKKHAPNFFGTEVVQYTSAFIVAICVPIAALKALKLLAEKKRRRDGFWILVFACLPLFCNLAMYGVGGIMMARVSLAIRTWHEPNPEWVAKLTDRSLSGESEAMRAKSAGILYGLLGVQPVWKNAKGELERYQPTVKQEEARRQTVETSQTAAETIKTIDWQLKQMMWLFGLNLGSFGVIFLAGLAWHAYRPNSEQNSEGDFD